MPIFDACLAAGADYLDMAMSLSKPHPEQPYELTGVKLGDEQFAKAADVGGGGPARPRRDRRRAGPVGRLRPLRRRTTSSREIDEAGVRDGANLTVEGYDFAPSFSIWTTIEECLNPPVIFERDRGWYTTAAVQRAGDRSTSRRASGRSSA